MTGDANFSLDEDGFHHDQNDLLVSVDSQLGGIQYNQTGNGATIYPNTVHTTGYIKAPDANIFSEINSPQIQRDVSNLLESDESDKFVNAIGIGSTCKIPR